MEDPGSDLSQLDKLTEESILEAVKNRYQEDKIYSSVGEDILLAVNPYKELPIYDKENHEKFLSENFKPNLPPHVFRMAAQAYLRMRQKQSNQIILVCGESGAGKTESAKYMVQHFMEMCPDDSGDLHERIIRVNPLLESFGNAKTVMNDNSSRFAKFLELSFGHDGQVIGASIRDYMLEKCRVVGRNEDCGEGNFHIFYGMFAGLSQQEKQDLFLLKLEKYSILKGSIKSLKMTNHYVNQYRDNMETLKKIGMTEADKKVMHCMLAAILHLSQIEFDETDKASGQLDIVDTELVEQAASLLEVSSEAIGHALISSTTIMAGDKIKVYKSLDQATDGRDALAKHMYERLFGWIVKKINKNLHPNHSSKRTKVAEIGILDIAGFENLQTNSFEQMCINMVNERLQYFMNNVVLIQEKKIYESEEIPFENVEFKDNMNIIQMFEISKIGIWPSLDEESKFRQGTDSKFVERLKKNFPKGHAYNPLLTFARGDRIGFGVKHFAGAVWYNCENFLEKNRDTLNKDIEDVMKSSKDDCIADLFSVRKGDTGTISSTLYDIRASRKVPGLGGSIRAKTDQGGLQGMDLGRTLKEKYGKVGKPTELIYMPNDSKTNVGYFQKSISQLLSKLRHADSFFVRCIKPNRQMAPDQLDEEVVKEQLKYNGISEICLIRKNGYPSRILIEDFIKRYKPLFSFRGSNNKDMVQTILEGTLPIEIRDKYRIGKNKDVKKTKRKVTFSTFSNNMPSHSSVSSNSRLTTELNSDNDTGKKNSTSTSKLRFWDMFSVIPRERKTQDVHTFRSLRIIKVCAYFILFLMLLASLVIQKISVITLISQLRPEKIWNGESEQSDKVQNNKAKVASACYMFTLLAMCTPYVFMFIGSAWMSIFKNIPFPSFSSIVVCVVIEILHSIGLCLLVFHLLPDLGVVQGIGLLSAVAIVPSLLKPFSSYNTYNEKKTSTARRRILFFVLDLMAILAQFSAIPVVIIPNTQFLHGNGTHTIGDLVNRYKNESMSTEFSINTPLHSFKIVGALFLCSLSWWENFVDDEICNTIPLPEAFVKIKSDLQERRPIIFLFVSFFKIGTSVVFAYLLMQDSLTFGFNEIGKYEEMDMYSDILALILSGYVGYYLAYTVCKLQMQRTAAKDSNSGAKDISPNDTEQTDVENIIPPMIYACATMWHENRVEMLQLLKSLFRMDKDQFERKQEFLKREKKETTEGKSLRDTDYYEFEAHILFDDAFESDDNEDSTPNRFVLEFASLMNEAASAVHSTLIEIKPPFIMPSHYGGQLIFVMPGNNFIYTHLKDKKEIRHKKRWSQAENTFLLALDGDVDFTPGAVRLLLDRMRKNLSVGAACGRIHPIGSGPMVWYQKFEYAVAHWLQKATEHVLGCVLCSPGCFSMFRGSALMDDNVMKKYTTLATEPSEHLMYDQVFLFVWDNHSGEDRWLCTLLLQQGYRVDYAAASDAFTYAPESFNEYFNQRRRWTPSTIANILDLLQDGRNTVASNNNISWLYIVYQGALMVSTIIGPATVLMMIAGALLTVFDISLVTSYVVSLIPAIIFFIICLVFDTKIQLIVAQILSGIYIFIMMVVFVGIVITAVTITPYHPSVIFLSGLVFIFLIAAALHPKEFHNLVFGILYFLWVPSGFLVLVIYSLCNLHVVSWGTREVPNKKTKAELEQEQAEKKAKEEQKKKESFWNKFFPFFNLVQELKQTMSEKMTSDKDKERDALVDILKKINDNLEKINMKKCDRDCGDIVHEEPSKKERKTVKFSDEPQIEEQGNISLKKKSNKEKKRNIDERCPAWIKKFGEHREPLLQMVAEEEAFWKEFVEKYLKPMEKDKRKEKEDTEKLKELRNNVCGGMALINMLWVAINFMFQYRKPTVISIPLPHGNKEEDIVEQSADNVLKVDVVGLMFIIFFLFILFVQFFGMIVHRWGTFMHLIAITEIPTPFRGRKTEKTLSVNMEEYTTTDLPGEPSGDYSSDEDDYDDDITEREEKDYFVTQIINNAETGTKDRVGQPKIKMKLRNFKLIRANKIFYGFNG
uniref:Myosin motor domain-containing protein n=1 Tax=Magallana gigas TaxID=29159 RepID=A0A8W8N3N0_MAGGI